MKRGQIVEGIVTRVNFPNKGVVRVKESEGAIAAGASEYRDVAVKGVLPGQKVSVCIKKGGRGNCQGNLVEVLEPSPKELDVPQCPHFGICGGCTYQSLTYEDQLALKEEQMRNVFTPVLGEETFTSVFEGVTSSPTQFEYRNKMEFSFGDEYMGGPLALGMHKKGSFYDIANVENCRIIDADMRKALTVTLNYFKEQQISYYHKMRHEGYLRHLLVRKAAKTGQMILDLVTSTQTEQLGVQERVLLGGWVELLQEQEWEGELLGVLHTNNDSLADVITDMGTDILYGQDYFMEELLGLNFKITPFSFFQTNSLGAEVLYETAREFIQGDNDNVSEVIQGKTVYDLYSGTGTIAQILSPACEHVIGVEIVEEAVEAAKENAKENHLSNCDFLAGDVLKVLDSIQEKPDYIVLDPPRDGIHPKALDKIIDYNVDSMVYISCKPTSLARDLVILQARGYEVKRMRCVDMFPFTGHVETVVLMSKVQK